MILTLTLQNLTTKTVDLSRYTLKREVIEPQQLIKNYEDTLGQVSVQLGDIWKCKIALDHADDQAEFINDFIANIANAKTISVSNNTLYNGEVIVETAPLQIEKKASGVISESSWELTLRSKNCVNQYDNMMTVTLNDGTNTFVIKGLKFKEYPKWEILSHKLFGGSHKQKVRKVWAVLELEFPNGTYQSAVKSMMKSFLQGNSFTLTATWARYFTSANALGVVLLPDSDPAIADEWERGLNTFSYSISFISADVLTLSQFEA